MNTDTPETDSAYIQRPNEGAWDFRVRQEKTMEKLERERDDAREELATVTAHRDRLLEQREQWRMSSVCRELTAQRDRLAEAFRSIVNELGVPQPGYPARVANAVKIADEALQSLTPKP